MTGPEKHHRLPEEFRFLTHITWDEVMALWKADEDNAHFRREYREEGYESWESWRQKIFDGLHLPRLPWALYELGEPTRIVPKFRGGPFESWKNMYYDGQNEPTFAEIVANSNTDVATREKFQAIITAVEPVTLIGLRRNEDIYVIEGMHRSTAIALAHIQGKDFNSPVRLALADTDLPKFPLIP